MLILASEARNQKKAIPKAVRSRARLPVTSRKLCTVSAIALRG